MHMVFKGELAVKLHAKYVEVGTRSYRNPGQNHVTMGMVHCPGSTNYYKASVLLGFPIMQQRLHHFWILAKFLLREASITGLSAGLRTTLAVWRHLHRQIVCSQQVQPFRWHIGQTEEDPTHFSVACLKRSGSNIQSFIAPSTTTLCPWWDRNSLQMDSTLPPTAIDFNLNKRQLWLTLANSALKSSWMI